MNLDGSPVNVNDSVYCTVLGPGTVMVAGASTVGVQFASSGQLTQYDDGGIGPWRRRTLYWADPVVFIPQKDQNKWNQTKALLLALRDFLIERGLL
jgi:hypothetical protein